MSLRYVLDGDGNPVVETDPVRWARWMGAQDRCLRRTAIGFASVSTIFIGTDEGHMDGKPVLWETKVFDGPAAMIKRTWRYTSRDEAIAGHDAAVKAVVGKG